MGNPDDELEQLASHPDLGGMASSLRAGWRDEEEGMARDALEAWTHQRTLVDVARELMHRGDAVAFLTTGTAFAGTIVEVGRDLVIVRGAPGDVDIHLAVPPMVRVVERAKTGGTSGGSGLSFRARLAEHEMAGLDVVVGTTHTGYALRGRLTLGADQIHLRGTDGAETYVPIVSIAYVAPGTDG